MNQHILKNLSDSLTDNLPCSTKIIGKDKQVQYEHGYRLGFVADDKAGFSRLFSWKFSRLFSRVWIISIVFIYFLPFWIFFCHLSTIEKIGECKNCCFVFFRYYIDDWIWWSVVVDIGSSWQIHSLHQTLYLNWVQKVIFEMFL